MAATILLVAGLIRPTIFTRIFKRYLSRRKILLFFGIPAGFLFIITGIVEVVQNPSSQDIAISSEEKAIYSTLFQTSFAQTSARFSEARIYTQALLTADKATSRDEWLKFADETIAKWKAAGTEEGTLEKVVQYAPAQKQTASLLTSKVYAAEEQELQLGINEKIVEVANQAPANQQAAVAVQFFKKDTKTSLEQLQALRQQVGNSEINWYDGATKTAQAIELASDVAITVGGTFGGAAAKTVLGKVATFVAVQIKGADLFANIGPRGMEIGLWDKDTASAMGVLGNNQYVKNAAMLINLSNTADLGNDAATLLKNIISPSTGKISARLVRQFIADPKNKQTIANMKNNLANHIQTVYNSGKMVNDYVNSNPDSKSLSIEKDLAIRQVSMPAITQNSNISMDEAKQWLEINKALTLILNAEKNATNGTTSSGSQTTPAQTEPTTAAENYDGTYYGSTDVSVGMSSANITVTGTSLSGHASYTESSSGHVFKMSINLSGTVGEDGYFSGRLSGSGTVPESTSVITASGSISGHISQNAMYLKYSVSSSAGIQDSGNVSLVK